MSLNRNAKGLKSDRRLEREMYVREETLINAFEESLLPRPPRNCWDRPMPDMALWATGIVQPLVCMHCWTNIYYVQDGFVHASNMKSRCYRKMIMPVAQVIPGILIINELDL